MSDPNDWNAAIIKEFHANDGKVGGMFENVALCLLHTTGAKSGQPRVTPLIATPHGEELVIIASAAGAPKSPAWYYNLKADPNVEIEYGTERFPVVATIVLDEPERTELYALAEADFAGYGDYVRKTTRVIPVIKLARV